MLFSKLNRWITFIVIVLLPISLFFLRDIGFNWLNLSLGLSIRWLFELVDKSVEQPYKNGNSFKLFYLIHFFLIAWVVFLGFSTFETENEMLMDIIIIVVGVSSLFFFVFSAYHISIFIENRRISYPIFFNYLILLILYPIGILILHDDVRKQKKGGS